MTDQNRVSEVPEGDLFRFSVSMPIRYGDIDAQRHLNNVAFFAFMEHARVAYLRELGLWEGRDFDGVGMILAETTCTYFVPAYLGETVLVWVRATHLGRKSFHLHYRLETERAEIAVGRSVQVCYDYGRQASVSLSDGWRNAIAAYEPGLDPVLGTGSAEQKQT